MPSKTGTKATAIAKNVPVRFITIYFQFRNSAFFGINGKRFV